MNGKLLGTTKPSGLMVLWQQGDRVTIEKEGFEPVKLHFSSPQPKKSITVTLRPIAAPIPQPQPSPPPKTVSGLPQVSAPRSRFTLRRVVLVTVAPLVVGIIVALIIVATHPPGPVSAPPPTAPPFDTPVPPPALAPARVLPPPLKPSRATNLVLASNQKMDKIIETVEYVLKFTNDERTQRGLPPLQSSAALAFIAQNHAENMCESRSLEHEATVFPDGWKTLNERLKLVGIGQGSENIAGERWQDRTANTRYARAGRNVSQEQLDRLDAESSAKWLVMKWMLNDDARTKMLDRAAQNIGVGICPVSEDAIYAVQVFSPKPGNIR